MTRRYLSDGRFAPPPAIFPREQTKKGEPWDRTPPPLQGWWNVLLTWLPAIIACAGLTWETLKVTGRI